MIEHAARAFDWRWIYERSFIFNDLERVGNLAENVAKRGTVRIRTVQCRLSRPIGGYRA
jgi:hypothetical protein